MHALQEVDKNYFISKSVFDKYSFTLILQHRFLLIGFVSSTKLCTLKVSHALTELFLSFCVHAYKAMCLVTTQVICSVFSQ